MTNNAIRESSGSFGSMPMGSRRQAWEQSQGVTAARMATSARPDQVAANPLNPRRFVDSVRQEELAQSLRTVGQLQPATVMTRDAFLEVVPEHTESIGAAEYVVLAGSSRLEAAKEAGLEEFLFHVRNSPQTREEIVEVALLENVQRVDLTPLEEAETLQALCEVYGTQGAVAERLSRSQGWVSQRLSLLSLAPPVQDDLRDGRVTVREARRLARLSPEEQEQARERNYYPVITGDDTEDSEPAQGKREPSQQQEQDQQAEPGADEPETDGSSTRSSRDRGTTAEQNDDDGHAEQVQLMLDLELEPAAAASEILSAYGPDRASALAKAIMDQL